MERKKYPTKPFLSDHQTQTFTWFNSHLYEYQENNQCQYMKIVEQLTITFMALLQDYEEQ